MSRDLHTRPFTPSRENREVLDRRTVGRDQELDRILSAIHRAATSANRSHMLVVGPRGSGKSHLVEVVLGRIELDPALAGRVVPVMVPEDTLGFTRVDDLLDHAITTMGGPKPSRSVTLPDRQVEVESLLGDRVLLLVVENLDRVMASLSTPGQRAFRGWVENSGKVLVLATTPLLFAGVQDRDQPWFGAFDTLFLAPLDAEQGQALLQHLADLGEDEDLATFLRTQTATRRIQALAELTGGSPRLWTVLADCITPRKLDDLIPVVRDLHERLTPYFQQLLWDLPPQAQRVVRALAEGPSSAMTVAEIDESADIGAGLSVVLKRLVADRWIEKVPLESGDRRRSFYRLREPMVRHHVQYRSGEGRPLALVTSLLRVAFDPDVRRRHLAQATSGTDAFEHVLQSLLEDARPSDAAYWTRDPEHLKAEALLWSRETGPFNRSEAGIALLGLLGDTDASLLDPDDLGGLLDEFALTATGRTSDVLALVSAGWNDGDDTTMDAEKLAAMVERLDDDDPLRLVARAMHAGHVEDDARATALLAVLVDDVVRIHGDRHPESLRVRADLASRAAATDDDRALGLFESLLEDVASLYGPDHPRTVLVALGRALEIGKAGSHMRALEEFTALAERSASAHGPDSPLTLTARRGATLQLMILGDHERSRDELLALVPDIERVFGVEDEAALSTRTALADALASSGSHVAARDLYVGLIEHHRTHPGADRHDLLRLRHDHAVAVGNAGDPSEGENLLRVLLPDLLDAAEHGTDGLAALVDLIGTTVAGLLTHQGSLEVPPPVAAMPALELLVRAMDGDPEAALRLPSELRSALPLLTRGTRD